MASSPDQTALRTHRAGSLSKADLGQIVRVAGWVHRRRDLGGLVFLDLRDRDGLLQLSCSPDWTPAAIIEQAGSLGAETVILATVQVELRPNPAPDESMISRDVEVYVTDLTVVGPAGTPAIPVARKDCRWRETSLMQHLLSKAVSPDSLSLSICLSRWSTIAQQLAEPTRRRTMQLVGWVKK